MGELVSHHLRPGVFRSLSWSLEPRDVSSQPGEPFLSTDRGTYQWDRRVAQLVRREPNIIEAKDAQGLVTRRDVQTSAYDWAQWRITSLEVTDPKKAAWHRKNLDGVVGEVEKIADSITCSATMDAASFTK